MTFHLGIKYNKKRLQKLVSPKEPLSLRTEFESSIRSDAFALKSLRDYQSGKMILYAWLSRGLTNVGDVADWLFDGDRTKVAELMKQTPGAMSKLLSLDSLPETGDDESKKQQLQLAETTRLPGESVSRWCVMKDETSSASSSSSSAPSSKPIPLPDWFKIPLDRTISIWKAEKDEWESKKNDRFKKKGTYELPLASNEKYKDNEFCFFELVRTYIYIYNCFLLLCHG